MKLFPFFFRFTKDQRKGVIALFMLIIVFQALYFVFTAMDFRQETANSPEEKRWLALQHEIDTLKAKSLSSKDTIYPFNPNYISDYKGYVLGMSVEQIDRLRKFREAGKFINSPSDFKIVTGIDDQLLAKLSPYFKFSGWAHDTKTDKHVEKLDTKTFHAEKAIIDINDALEEDLVKVYGIGPYYAKVLLRRRADLGAFVSMDQIEDFKELTKEAKAGLKESFKVTGQPLVNKINVNTASLQQLSRFPYFDKNIAKGILTQRSMNGKINTIDELLEISAFPVDKVKIIALYLEF
jgi:DNA uptake protein ComE-like DNA-binding protein